ncbi:uncharacterized protein RB166_017859 [Leptodactylus fuscus]
MKIFIFFALTIVRVYSDYDGDEPTPLKTISEPSTTPGTSDSSFKCDAPHVNAKSKDKGCLEHAMKHDQSFERNIADWLSNVRDNRGLSYQNFKGEFVNVMKCAGCEPAATESTPVSL